METGKRIAVIGCPGAGKSTVSLRLAKLLGFPLLHLDEMYHDAAKWSTDRSEKRQQWRAYQEERVRRETWIIDGEYKSTLPLRIAAADTILYLDYPRWLCFSRALLRSLKWYVNRERIAGGNPGRVDAAFLRYIWEYRARERPRVLELLEQHRGDKQIFICAHPEETEVFLQRLQAVA